jgi:hypothetical protein
MLEDGSLVASLGKLAAQPGCGANGELGARKFREHGITDEFDHSPFVSRDCFARQRL